ncbi:DeoR/GlpR family DNA-binding transcription regulator [Aestuariivirga sp.]|uniref:DeoR/GlpR family DNA-binding transcription regulator n=1 Tax=Aestuariivirga sp. TaxID=2650926 RepID=UPI003593B421
MPIRLPERHSSAGFRPLAQQRHIHILSKLASVGTVQVGMLARDLRVSEMTIRRDLVDLEKEGRLTRIHGGAVDTGKHRRTVIDRDEPLFEARLQRQYEAKQRIAAAAARLAAGCKTIALDVGSTTLLLARQLHGESQAKIFTNSVRIAADLAAHTAEVYLPGGRMRRDEMSIGGRTAVEQFQDLWFDIAFVGVSGMTTSGIFDYSFEDVDMKRVYLRRSSMKVVLCDASKFERMSLVHIAPLDGFDILITDAAPPPQIAKALADANVRVDIVTDTD